MKVNLLCTSLLLITFGLQAAPITSDITIYTEVSFDDSPGGEAIGSATQTATMELVAGGSPQSSQIDDTNVSGNQTLMGDFTELMDSIEIDAVTSGSVDAELPGFGFDVFFELSNSSITDAYAVSFTLFYESTANAQGDDAFVDIEMDLLDDNFDDIWFLDMSSDTSFGNYINNTDTGDFGGEVTSSGSQAFTIELNPGDILTLNGQFTTWAGAFADNATFASQSNYAIQLTDVQNVTDPNPNPIPEPATLLMFLAGLLGLRARK